MNPSSMYDPLFSTSEVSRLLSDREFFRAMLLFERALSESLELTSEVPSGAASALAQIDVDQLDLPAICQDGASAGNLCIPFVKALTAVVKRVDPEAAAYVHWGATSQDVIDTALLLQLRSVWRAIERDLSSTCEALAHRVVELRHTVMPGRTWLQQGPPVTMGFKMATWLDALQRHRVRMAEAAPRIFSLQFGGAVGTLAPLGKHGPEVAQLLADRLQLTLPSISWHTQRDRIAEFSTLLAMIVGTLGKMARDVSLLMQTEVGEFLEPVAEGKGGSSTMPHKRNPVGCAVMLSASIRTPALTSTILSAMVQEHERGLGGWHAEWETVAEITRLAAGSLANALEIARDGRTETIAMQHNLIFLKDVTMAEAASFLLARRIGKAQAHHILEKASRCAVEAGTSLLLQLQTEPEVTKHCSLAELEEAMSPATYLGATHAFINAVLEKERLWNSDASH